jgi:hypothetical protein
MIKIILFIALMLPCSAYAGVVDIAQSNIGKGEIGKDNGGWQVKMFTGGKEVPWCAGFVSYVMTKAGKLNKTILRAYDFWEMKDKRVLNPKPGDIICLFRGSRYSGKSHVGIIESVSNGKIVAIEGNYGKYPALVKRVTYVGEVKNLLGYIRL